MGSNRYGNEFHQFLVAVSLAKLGVKDGKVDLNLFAPPGLYNDLKPIIQERFMEDGGKVEIKLKGDKNLAPGRIRRSRFGRKASARRPALSSMTMVNSFPPTCFRAMSLCSTSARTP